MTRALKKDHPVKGVVLEFPCIGLRTTHEWPFQRCIITSLLSCASTFFDRTYAIRDDLYSYRAADRISSFRTTRNK